MTPFPARTPGTPPRERDREHTNALSLLWRDGHTLLWIMVAGEFLAAILTLALDTAGLLARFTVVSLAVQVVVLLTIVSLYLLRLQLEKLPPSRAAYAAFGVMMASALAVAVATRFAFEPMVALSPAQWSSLVARSVGIIAIAGVMGLATLQNHWRIKQLALQAKHAQLEALQARIQPHFLFNTLNTAIALVRSQPDRAERVLLDLADLFRAALAAPAHVPLRQELALVRRYLDIESTRLGDRLRLVWTEDDVPETVQVPSLSIQPLVENAVRHGVEASIAGGALAIGIRRLADEVIVEIANDMPAAGSLATGHRVGLRSARERVAALGNGARVETSRSDGRHVATVHFPIR